MTEYSKYVDYGFIHSASIDDGTASRCVFMTLSANYENMTSGTTATSLISREHPETEPITEHRSKLVMIRAERHDRIEIESVKTRFRSDRLIPDDLTVARRTDAYFGPKLLLDNGTENYLLTAPGPETQLLLWCSEFADDGLQRGWQKLAEVTATFTDEQPQYDLCPMCGDPLKTLEHEREAAFGMCPNVDDA